MDNTGTYYGVILNDTHLGNGLIRELRHHASHMLDRASPATFATGSHEPSAGWPPKAPTHVEPAARLRVRTD